MLLADRQSFLGATYDYEHRHPTFVQPSYASFRRHLLGMLSINAFRLKDTVTRREGGQTIG
jgi:hypothetical protein